MNPSSQWIDQAHQHRKLKKLILDMDALVSEAYGHQEGSAYNGHFACTCYHLLLLFNQFGDLERVLLRRGNRGSAKFWRRVLLPVIERYRGLDIPKLIFDSLLSSLGVEMRFSAGFCGVGLSTRKT